MDSTVKTQDQDQEWIPEMEDKVETIMHSDIYTFKKN